MSAPDIQKFVQDGIDDGFYSPDTPDLFLKKWHPVFVYGSLKQGFSRSEALKYCLFLGNAFTRHTGWTMYRTAPSRALNHYPIIFNCVGKEQPGSVFGEVYLIPPEVLRTLDLLESNGVLYHRTYRVVDVFCKGETRTMPAWMYAGKRSEWQDAIQKKGLVPCDLFTRKDQTNFQYYLFTKEYTRNAPLRNL